MCTAAIWGQGSGLQDYQQLLPQDPGCISPPTPARLGCLCWGHKLKPSCSHSSSSRATFPMKPNTPQLLAPLCAFQRYLQRLYPSPKCWLILGASPPRAVAWTDVWQCPPQRLPAWPPSQQSSRVLVNHIHMKLKPVFFWFCSIFSGSGHSCIFIFLSVYLYL